MSFSLCIVRVVLCIGKEKLLICIRYILGKVTTVDGHFPWRAARFYIIIVANLFLFANAGKFPARRIVHERKLYAEEGETVGGPRGFFRSRPDYVRKY